MSNDSVINTFASFDDLFNSGAKGKPKEQPSPARSAVQLVSTSGKPIAHRLAALQYPTPPQNPKAPSHAVIAEWFDPLREARKVTATGALTRDKLDDRIVTKKGKSVAQLTTNQMEFVPTFGKDGDILNVVRGLNLLAFQKADLEEFATAFEESLHYIGSSGTIQGVVHRLRQGMLSSGDVRLNRKKCVEWAQSTISYQKIDYVYADQGAVEVIRDLWKKGHIKFNQQGSAGIPYNKKTGAPGVFKDACEVAEAILDAIATGKYAEYMGKQRPALLGVLLKNKQDFYRIDQLETKVRPYFVYGLHERLLYTSLQCLLKPHRFDENEHPDPKGSAVGFSWNHGGGDRLYKWITKDNSPGTFRSIFYGDDQLWVITLIDGRTYVLTPDFSHMDLSLVADWAQVCYDVWRPYYSNLDKTWSSVLKFNCKRAFVRPVVIEGPMTYEFKSGLGSGIPGTTKFDEVASAAVNGMVKEAFETSAASIPDKSALVIFLKEMAGTVKKGFGLTFKEDTLTPYLFEPNRASYEFVFLGQSLKRMFGKDRAHYVPVPSLTKLMISATTFKKRFKSSAIKGQATMEKIRSLYAGGGIHYPVLASVLHSYYQILEKRNLTPINVEENLDDYYLETERSNFLVMDFPDTSWPSHEWVYNLYLPVDDQMVEFSGLSNVDVESQPSGAQMGSLDLGLDDFDSDYSESESSEFDPGNVDVEVSDVAVEDDFGEGPSGLKSEVIRTPPRVNPPKSLADPHMEALVEEAIGKREWGQDDRRTFIGKPGIVDVGAENLPSFPPVQTVDQQVLIQSKWTKEQKEAHKASILAARAQARAAKQAQVDQAKAAALKKKTKGVRSGGKTSRKSAIHQSFDDFDQEEMVESLAYAEFSDYSD